MLLSVVALVAVSAVAGAGYALQNREVTSRVFPSLYRDSEDEPGERRMKVYRAEEISQIPQEVAS